jgi:ATP-dependent Lhr-like helicase
MCEDASIPNEFFPHHGSLAKELRHEVETRLREGRLPTTAVCTTTLELGIDIGDVESIAQLGAPRSIAALRQRLGRSGRRPGKPSILRIYIDEEPIDAQSSLLLRLRLDTVLAVAAVRLLLAGWCEPPPQRALHLSTLLHQILSMIAAQGGAKATALHQTLCATGPFGNISRSLFSQLLRRMGDPEVELVEQAPDGTLLLGREGERVVEHYTFYAVFETPAEYRVVAEGKTLGTVPISFPVRRNDLIIFAGRRWEVIELHERQKVVEVKRARGGMPPTFGGEGVALHDQIVKEMRKVFTSTDLPTYLDAQGRSLLDEGREAFRMAELDRVSIVANGESTLLFPWVGTRQLVTLAMALTAEGLKTRLDDMVIIADHSVEEVRAALAHLSQNAPPAPLYLARQVANKQHDKYDRYLNEELLSLSFAGRALTTNELPELSAVLIRGCSRV